MEREFKECDTCAKKPGSPYLCEGCLSNRTLISTMRRVIDKKTSRLRIISDIINDI